MKIAFMVLRSTFYKYFASVIDEGLQKGHEVFCFHDYSQPRSGNKDYQFPYKENIPKFFNEKPKVFDYNGENDFVKKIKDHNIDVIISLHYTKKQINLRKTLKQQGIVWVCLQHSFDTILHADNLDFPDKALIYSDIWLDWILKYAVASGNLTENNIESKKQELKNKVIKNIGFVEIDQKKLVDKEKIKKRWNIPARKRVVLFLPFPFGSGRDIWSYFIYSQRDKFLVKSLKKFCEKNNAFLLVKSRKKDIVKPYLEKVADKVLYDENFYPATILECLSISDLCINFYSSTVTEAIAMSTPNICIATSKRWSGVNNILWKTILKEVRDNKGESIFDFEKASYILSISQFIKKMKKAKFSDFILDKKQQSLYIEKFVGELDVNYSKKALNEVEMLVNTHKID